MRLWTVVCVVAVGMISGCDAPPQAILERAGIAQGGTLAAQAPGAVEVEKDCGCGTGDCPNAPENPADSAAKAPVYQRVNVDGAPTATFVRDGLHEADRRTSEEALITVAVFSDYECPYCARGDQTLQALAQEYGDRLRVVMKQMPLPMHRNAERAAAAALAAGEQGKYWEMHERLFANRRALDEASLEKHAQELGLDLARFQASLASPAHAERIQRDLAEAAALGVRGTPAFFINGRRLDGAQPAATFKRLIDEELVRAERLLASGVSRSQLYDRLTQ